jgi:hypothetical protein
MTWVLSDGTEVDLGGEVRGASMFAQELRILFEQPGMTVSVGPYPGHEFLDLNKAWLVDTFLREHGEMPVRAEKVKIVSAPKFEKPSRPAPKFDPSVVY